MSRARDWRRHADALITERERLYPGAVPMREGIDVCPLHDEPLGLLTNMCVVCFHEAWDWTARALEDGRLPGGNR